MSKLCMMDHNHTDTICHAVLTVTQLVTGYLTQLGVYLLWVWAQVCNLYLCLSCYCCDWEDLVEGQQMHAGNLEIESEDTSINAT